MKKYKQGRGLSLTELVGEIASGQSVMWNGKPKNASFLVHLSLYTLKGAAATGIVHKAELVEGKK